jgi:hypothetical protein
MKPVTCTRRLLVGLAATAALAGPVAQARAATTEVVRSTSSNWAGYAVASSDPATPVSYTSVSGAWVQPAATCTRGQKTYSAFWVGLGGVADVAQTLEQIGTESNCAADGTATYDVWYELVPAASVPVKLRIFPGNRVSASVTVSGQLVTVELKNLTRKTSFTKRLTMAAPDVSSAEWIAEAPSACADSGGCTTLPLANFGTLSFTSAKATASGHTGTISDAAWSPTAIDLEGSAGGSFGRRFGAMAPAAGATPGDLSRDGASFSVAWLESAPDQGGPPAS